jgi:transcriptional regulator with XRE-family HTH domain
LSQGNTHQRNELLKDFSLRLQQAVDKSIYKDLEQGVLSERIGVSRQALRKWLKGIALPSQVRLPLISDILNINLIWLATGEGLMSKHKDIIINTDNANETNELLFSITQIEIELIEKFRQLTETDQQSFSLLFESLSK